MGQRCFSLLVGSGKLCEVELGAVVVVLHLLVFSTSADFPYLWVWCTHAGSAQTANALNLLAATVGATRDAARAMGQRCFSLLVGSGKLCEVELGAVVAVLHLLVFSTSAEFLWSNLR